MGVLNLTPDSFSDGGRFHLSGKIDVSAVVDAAAVMVEQGTDWLDIGGESTRPGARAVSEQEELDRVIPALESLVDRFETPVSIDTSSPAVILDSSAAGAKMINDVRALTRRGALEAFVGTSMRLCIMHMKGDPSSMQNAPSYDSVVQEVRAYLRQRMNLVVEQGVSKERIFLDPGFGFGKSLAHNLQLLHGISEIEELGCPVLVGLSRKSMIGKITGRDVDQRLAGTIGLNMLALRAGASILRVHDVAEAVDTVKIWQSYAHHEVAPAE